MGLVGPDVDRQSLDHCDLPSFLTGPGQCGAPTEQTADVSHGRGAKGFRAIMASLNDR